MVDIQAALENLENVIVRRRNYLVPTNKIAFYSLIKNSAYDMQHVSFFASETWVPKITEDKYNFHGNFFLFTLRKVFEEKQ